MKKIYVCLDSLNFNEWVRDYGIYIASKFNRELCFIYILENLDINPEFYGIAAGGIIIGENDTILNECFKNDEENQEKCLEKASGELTKWVEEANSKGVMATSIIRKGDFIDVISEYKDDTLMFISEIRHSEEESVNFNLLMMIKEFKIPTLLINKEFSPINSALVAFSDNEISKKKLEFLKAHSYFSEIKKYVINVNEDEKKSAEILDLAREILSDKNSEFLSIKGSKAGEELIKFRRANSLDLVITGSFSKSFFKKLIVGSVSESILENALVPILVFA